MAPPTIRSDIDSAELGPDRARLRSPQKTEKLTDVATAPPPPPPPPHPTRDTSIDPKSRTLASCISASDASDGDRHHFILDAALMSRATTCKISLMSPLGRFEYDLLQFLCEKPNRSVREIYDEFGKPNGLVRGTIVKAMDRLLKKGRVVREQGEGLFRYSSVASAEQLEKDLVESFVRDRLRGNLTPLASFLAETKTLSKAEAEALRQILDRDSGSD